MGAIRDPLRIPTDVEVGPGSRDRARSLPLTCGRLAGMTGLFQSTKADSNTLQKKLTGSTSTVTRTDFAGVAAPSQARR